MERRKDEGVLAEPLITSSEHHFYLYEYPLLEPATGAERRVPFIVIEQLYGVDPWSAAIHELLAAARTVGTSHPFWEAFTLAHYWASSHPASGRRGSKTVPKLSGKSARQALERKAKRGELTDWEGEVPAKEYWELKLDQCSRFREDSDRVFLYAEFGIFRDGPEIVPSFPAFRQWAQQFTKHFEATESKPVSWPEPRPDGMLEWRYSRKWSDQLFAEANHHGLDRDDALGSRIVASSLETHFESALNEIEREYPEQWSEVTAVGQRLHDLFYRRQPGTGGALLAVPVLGDGLMLRVHDPAKVALGHLRRPDVDRLLATAAFEPSRLDEVVREIAGMGMAVRYVMSDDDRPSKLERRQYSISDEKVAARVERDVAGRGYTSDDVDRLTANEGLGYAVTTGILSEREGDILKGFFFEERSLKELAKKLGYSDKTSVSRAKRRALEKLREKAASDPQLTDFCDGFLDTSAAEDSESAESECT